MNYKAVYRTALATPGLFKIYNNGLQFSFLNTYRLNWPRGQFSTESLKRCYAKRVLKLDDWYKSYDNVKWGLQIDILYMNKLNILVFTRSDFCDLQF